MEEIYNVINNVGFPIVCCIFMFKQNQTLTQSISNLSVTLTNIDRRLELLEKVVEKHEQSK